jgi:hypothetical protein
MPTFLRSRSYCTKLAICTGLLSLLNLQVQELYVFKEVDADTPSHSKGLLEVHNRQAEVIFAAVVRDSSSALFCRNLRMPSTPAAHLKVGRNSNTSPAAFCRDSL